MTTTTPNVPSPVKGLTVSPSGTNRNGLYIEANFMVSWNPIGSTGGPLRFVFHDNAIVVLSPDNRNEDNGFYLRGVPYSIRLDLLKQPDGSFAPKADYTGRIGARRLDKNFGLNEASRPAARDLEAIVLAVAAKVLFERRDLVLAGSVKSLQTTVERAERKVAEQEAELADAQEALRAAREQLHLAQWAEQTDR